MNKALRYFAAFGSAFLVSLVGLAWNMIAPSSGRVILFGILSLVPALLLAGNLIAAKAFMSNINRAKVADVQSKMLRQRQLAQEASGKLLFKLQSIRRATTVYAILVWVLGACAALFAGMMYSVATGLFYLCVFYAGLIFHAAYSRIYKPIPPEINPNAPVLSRNEYPKIYAAVDRAANALGCRGEIIVRLNMDCNAGILRDGNKYYLQIGIVLLNILSEEELYSVCLHEFSHVADKNRANDYEMKYGAWIGGGKPYGGLMLFVNNIFTFFDVYYLFNHMIYSYATSVVYESEADRDMLTHGDAKTAASALLKLSYDDKFQWENGVDDEPMFASETPDPHFLSGRIAVFKAAIEARHADWDAMIDLEILPNNASHPTKKMRFEILGIEKPTLLEDISSPEYRAELQKALDYADEKFAQGWVNYEQSRKEAYLEPFARVTAWQEAGCPVTAEGFGDILSDLRQLCRQTEADELCERAIAELDENSSPLAYYQKGCKLLYRYDPAGVDLIYHAMEINHNFMEEGLQIIGQFYCMTGREKELQEYRARAQQMAQKDKDEYSQTGILSKNDKLSAEHLPDGMLEDILAFIRSIDGDIVKNIYLVRKTISETFFTSAFVIHFWGGTDEQRDEIMHKIFRYLDTYPVDWQFSLFDYADHSDIKFDKIEGSLVFTKNNNKGDQKQ